MQFRPSDTSLSSGRTQLLDLAGDGRLSAVLLEGPQPGFATRTESGGWESYRSFKQLPSIDWDDPNLRFTDLDNDGRTDLLLTGDSTFTWYGSLGETGFGPAHVTAEPPGEPESARLVFADGEQAVYLADMIGDGLSDLVRIRNGKVVLLAQSRLRTIRRRGCARQLALVRPTGTVRPAPDSTCRLPRQRNDRHHSTLGADGARLYLNQSGNRLTDARPLRGLPPSQNPIAVQNHLTCSARGTPLSDLVLSTPQ
ncbi:FG-GAP repeat domain-containing protein [Streptomyces sp. L7]